MKIARLNRAESLRLISSSFRAEQPSLNLTRFSFSVAGRGKARRELQAFVKIP